MTIDLRFGRNFIDSSSVRYAARMIVRAADLADAYNAALEVE